MGCCVLLFALLSPRLALVATWLFADILSRSCDDSWVLPLIGFFILPWTTLAWAWMWKSGHTVEGIEWLVVGVAVLLDLGSLFGGSRSRR